MIPPPLFSAALFQLLICEMAEFLSEIEERLNLKQSALLKEVVG